MRCLAAEGIPAAAADAVARLDIDAFDDDRGLHRFPCVAAGQPEAHCTAQAMKTQVDRLCLLSPGHGCGMAGLVEEHRRIAATIGGGNKGVASAAMRARLSRLDGTIAGSGAANPSFSRAKPPPRP